MLLYSNEPAPKGELGDRWPEWSAGRERRAVAARKRSVYEESHKSLVMALVRDRMNNPEVGAYVEKFVSTSPNLTKAVVDAVAVSYRRGCRRELHGASEQVAKAFSEIVSESGIDRKASGLNARSWISGPVSVSPHLNTRVRLALDTLNADEIELRWSAMSNDEIEAALWRSGSTWIELTADAWRYYNLDGDLVKTVLHAVGATPLVPFVSVDNTSDFWSQSAHSGLISATLEVGYKMAYGLWVRQVSANKLTAIYATTENIPGGQSLGHPALPLVFNCTPAEAKVEVHDRIVPAADHLSEIAGIITMAISVYGLPPGSVQMVANNSDWGNLAINVEGNRLGVLRDRQVQHLRHSELELWPLACDLIRGSTHRHARVLPGGDEVREMLRVSYPDLAEPKEEIASIEAMVAGLPYGLTSPVDYIRARRPELTAAEAEEEVQKNLARYINTIEPLVNRNTPKNAPAADGFQTVSQEQGREGGIASGESRNEESES